MSGRPAKRGIIEAGLARNAQLSILMPTSIPTKMPSDTESPPGAPSARRRSSVYETIQDVHAEILSPAAKENVNWNNIPLAMAILPAVSGMFFTNGVHFVGDIILLFLAATFLHWLIKFPWDWYHDSQIFSLDTEPSTGIILEEDERGEKSDDSDATLKIGHGQVNKISQRASLELARDRKFALIFCFAGPLLGAWLLYAIRSQLSRPGESVLSTFNITVFVLGAEIRPSAHVINLIRSRTRELQNARQRPPPSKIQEMTSKIEELSLQLQLLRSAMNDEDELLGSVKKGIQPDLDALNRYVFDSKSSIRPFLEPTASGITTQWAQATSRRLKCYTFVGYPELADGYTPPKQSLQRPATYDPFSETPIDVDEDDADDKIQSYSYNACVVTSPDGEVVTNYRKTFLYTTDEIWASEGSSFSTLTLTIPSKSSPSSSSSSPGVAKSVTVALGICMDLNPYRFTAPFTKYEFANHVLSTGAQLVIMPMAWETKDKLDLSHLKLIPRARHSSTIGYWAMRLQPLFGDGEDEDEEEEEDDEYDEEEEDADGEEVGEDEDEEEMEDVSAEEDADDDDAMGTVTPAELEDGNDEEEKWVKLSESDAAAAAAAAPEANFKPLDKVVFVACNRSGKEGKTLFVGSSSIMTIEKTDGTRKGTMANLEALGMAEERLLIADADI
ncbi:hypothetical protein Dda_0169 [Drechslerella dactyloides]|uniref:CN hydrolase domain-containing protein n=1 Tax=Drechslerella dactyloides TaxID=74499 RepID=A0AAD6J658_DREDA|nr:hypothetical protein Dda_0169 [Drechslerella dactyloides]